MLDVGLAPTIFETRSNVGGLWAPRVDGVKSHQLNPEMSINGSRLTTMFSDHFIPSKEGDKFELHPTVVTMGNYLNSYAKQLLSEATIRLSTTVINISPENEGEYPEWRVISKDTTGKQLSEVYQYVIIATGVFSNQYIPYAETLKHFKGTAVHSGDYNGSEQLIDPKEGKGKIVMIVGGTISGLEGCSDIGLRISSLPEEQRLKSRVINVYASPPWIIPKWMAIPNPADPLAPKVLPVDLGLFNPGSFTAPPVKSVAEKNNRTNDRFTILMGNQSSIDPELSTKGKWRNKPPRLGPSDSYDKFVRCGIIKPVCGRFSGVQEGGKVRVVDENGELLLGGPLDVDVLYFATGYSYHGTLRNMFAPELLAKIGLDPLTKNPSSRKVSYDMMHKYVLAPGIGRTIGFVGLLARAFWGILEMQGRYLGSLFSGKIPWPAEDIVDFSKGSDHLISIGKVREGLLEDTDFLGIVASYAKECGFDPFKPILGQNHPPRAFTPAYFPALNPSGLEPRNSALSFLSQVLEMADSPQFVSKSVFTEMNGKWRIARKLTSQLPGFPDGEFTGTGYFRARLDTFEPVRSKLGEYTVEPAIRRFPMGRIVSEYLYSEDGELVTKAGMKLEAKRSYVYRYDEVAERITSWFVKPDGETVDYFFHDLSFEKQPEAIDGSSVDQPGGWKATGEHLCNQDRYYVAYRFAYKGSRLEKFWIRYKVIGPKKNYVSETEYVRL
jgi:hypothetical protein